MRKLVNMRWMRVALVVSVGATGLLGWSVAAGGEKTPAAQGTGKAGVVTRDFTPAEPRNWRGAETHTLHTVIWYPAVQSAVETPQIVGPPDRPLLEAGSAMPHAGFAPSLTKLPLIVLSHGTGGSAQQMAWLGTALARAGFVAAAVDHPGNNAGGKYTAEGFVLWWERATDLHDVLDGLLADPELGPHIDHDRIGAAGFSLGGYTVLESGGARTDISVVYDLCRQQKNDPTCTVPEMREVGTPEQMLAAVRKSSGESLARSADSFRDPRIGAVFAIAPALGIAFTQESLRSMRVPVEIVVGSADPIAPAAENADRVHREVRGSRETVLPGVGHYTFLDVCTAAGTKEMSLFCTD